MGTAGILMTVGGLAVLVALAVLRRGNMARGKGRAEAAAATDDYRRTRDKADLGLVCPGCGAVAEPLGDTHDRYRCVGCGNQFTAESHEWRSE
jgi:hypothetical protein